MNRESKWNEILEKSPIFNMSLSSKELFHSNFIAWSLETYPEIAGKLLNKVFQLDNTEDMTIVNVQREKKSIDLSFILGNTLVLIENKVKSIAYKEQLDKYAQYSSKVFTQEKYEKPIKYILLSLNKPTFISSDTYETSEGKQWLFVSYKNFIENFLNPLSNKIDNAYHKFLIEDYIEFIEIIDKHIVSEIKNVNIVDLYKNNTADNQLLNLVSKLRMHDLFQKSIFEKFANDVYEGLKKQNRNLVINLNHKETDDSKTGYISISSGMTNATGLLHVFYKCDKNFSLGVQIQGNQYRIFIEGEPSESILQLACKYKKDIFLFNKIFNENIISKKDNLQLKKDLEDRIDFNNKNDLSWDFNKFYTKRTNALFLYKYVRLDTTDMSNVELIDMIINDLRGMIHRVCKTT